VSPLKAPVKQRSKFSVVMMNPFTWLVTTLVGGPVGTNALLVVPVHVAVVAWPRGRSIRTGTARSVRRMIGLIAIFASRILSRSEFSALDFGSKTNTRNIQHFVRDGSCSVDTIVQIEASPADKGE